MSRPSCWHRFMFHLGFACIDALIPLGGLQVLHNHVKVLSYLIKKCNTIPNVPLKPSMKAPHGAWCV